MLMFVSKNIVQTSMRQDVPIRANEALAPSSLVSNNALMCEKCLLALGS
jgi:hypothetical protein